ncbi:MAG: DUF4920 domain-containing protein [Gemmatimonadaceae bacterium]|nr:DUF4920 domain-containing protein [Gemmatimonadaceae bacterium]
MRLSRLALAAAVLFAAPLTAQTVTDSAIVRRGAPVPAGEAIAVTQLVASARTYTDRAVLVEGIITRECTEKGCWMQVAPTSDARGMRVTFKDYGFFIPQSMVGRKARMEGMTKVTTHSKAAADHLIGEGAQLVRNSDGTATEVQFVANGVELFKN